MNERGDARSKALERFVAEWSRRDFLRRMGAGAALAAFAAAPTALLAACSTGGGHGPDNFAQVAPRSGGHVVEGSTADLTTLNPVLAADSISAMLGAMIYDSLYMDDDKGNPQPLLATSPPDISADGKTYTVSLVDATWTDGQPITADDVKFTYDLMIDPAYAAVRSPRRTPLSAYLAGVAVKDPKTVVFQLRQVFAPMAGAHLQYGILPKHVWGGLAAADVNATELNTAPTVTSGPFRDATWQRGVQVSFAANGNYHRGRPYLDTWLYKVVANSGSLLAQLKTGEIDIANGLDPAQYDAARSTGGIDVQSYTALSFVFYLYNLDPAKSRLWQDKRVRQALLYALDRESMVKAVYFNQAAVAGSTEPPASWAYQPVPPQYGYDKGRAQQLLDDAGFARGDDGIRARGDVRLEFEMLTNRDNQARMNLLTAMQDQWREIGVDATPRGVDFNLDLVPQITTTRTFQLLLIGFQWSNDPDQQEVWASPATAPGGFNGMGYRNPDLDKVMSDAVSTLDQAKRKDLYRRMQQILADDVPAPVLLFTNDIVATNRRVRGFAPNAFADRFAGRRIYVKDVFVTDGK